HLTTPGQRGCVAGQGELKKVAFDPLFSINHTFAMCRANINRLLRRTWCTTKRPDRLVAHLDLYVNFHNRRLLPGK
ncbi:MAG: transposase, partial [Bdellovibrionales bacterium]|nr:transposase [Bdellovibrionales bacterium]